MSQQPNIILITWHDAGRWFGCYGNRHVQTPHVDRLAAEGCRFANTLAACAICSPSRAAIVTGRFCQDNGVMYLTNTVNNNRLHQTERHVARLLKEDHGYRTALFGVQHECAHEHVSDVLAPDERFNTDPWPAADVTADAVCRWLAARRDEATPFYAQIGLYEAHLGSYYSGVEKANYPWARDEERGVFMPPYLADSAGSRNAVATLQGLLRRGDAAIGRMLAALRRAGKEESTIVMLCVDHGVGLCGAKTTCYDPGIAVAWIVRQPGQIRPGTVVDAMTAHVDTLPTLLDLAGLPKPGNLHGISFAAHARGARANELRDEAFSHMVENTRSIRTHRFKFIRHFRPPHEHSQSTATLAPERTRTMTAGVHVELYDLAHDPHEFTNIAEQPGYAEVRRDLDARLWHFLLDHNDFVINEPVTTPWQAESRRALEAHCAAAGRRAPVIDTGGAGACR